MKRRMSWLVFVCVFLLLCRVQERISRAELETAVSGTGDEEKITVYSDVFFSEPENHVPESSYKDEVGKVYELKEWSINPAVSESRSEQEQAHVLYEGGESIQCISDSWEVKARDQLTGGWGRGICGMSEIEEDRERWSANFSFTAVFHGYGSDSFLLGDVSVPFCEEKPQLETVGQELLKYIGLNVSDYRILDAQWDGPAYEDDTGIICRNATVKGEKKVRDYKVIYKGNVVFPESRGFRCMAVYSPLDEEVYQKPSGEEKTVKEKGENPMKTRMPSAWERVKKFLTVTITALAVVLLLAVLIYSEQLLKRRREQKSLRKKGGV